jgi:carboxylate-amine ligase
MDPRTIGAELEFQLVTEQTLTLTGAAPLILAGIPAALKDRVKPEFEASCLEIVSTPHTAVESLFDELAATIAQVAQVAYARREVRLLGLGTHPTAHWHDQQVYPDSRYSRLIVEMGDSIRRTVTFGLHVHVGCAGPDDMIATCRRLTGWVPLFVALSGSSPYWCGRDMGVASYRTEVCDPLPPGGPMPPFASHAEYAAALAHWVDLGLVDSPRDVWWDVRPSPAYGTAEVRVFDMVPLLGDAASLAALVQCLAGPEISAPNCDETTLKVCRARAARKGIRADVPAPGCGQLLPVPALLADLMPRLEPIAEELGCGWLIERLDLFSHRSWADRVRQGMASQGLESLRPSLVRVG